MQSRDEPPHDLGEFRILLEDRIAHTGSSFGAPFSNNWSASVSVACPRSRRCRASATRSGFIEVQLRGRVSARTWYMSRQDREAPTLQTPAGRCRLDGSLAPRAISSTQSSTPVSASHTSTKTRYLTRLYRGRWP